MHWQLDVSEGLPLPFEAEWSGPARRSTVATYSKLYLAEICRGGSQTEESAKAQACAATNLELLHSTRWAVDAKPAATAAVKAAAARAAAARAAAGGCSGGGGHANCGGESPEVCAASVSCSVSQLGLDSAAEQDFLRKAQAAASALREHDNPDAAHGPSVLALLGWGRLEQLAEWAVADWIEAGAPPAAAVGEFIRQMVGACQ